VSAADNAWQTKAIKAIIETDPLIALLLSRVHGPTRADAISIFVHILSGLLYTHINFAFDNLH
jgi:hypothetical protein